MLAEENPPATQAFAGFDPRKITLGDNARVTDLDGNTIGTILTCTTDMAIDRVDGRIISLATPMEEGRPDPFTPRGLCCGFVRLNTAFPVGSEIILTRITSYNVCYTKLLRGPMNRGNCAVGLNKMVVAFAHSAWPVCRPGNLPMP